MEKTECLRKTGRTTRMLEKAIHLANKGKTVYVIMSTLKEARHQQKQLNSKGLKDLDIKFETLQDFNGGCGINLTNCAILIDHYVIDKVEGYGCTKRESLWNIMSRGAYVRCC